MGRKPGKRTVYGQETDIRRLKTRAAACGRRHEPAILEVISGRPVRPMRSLDARRSAANPCAPFNDNVETWNGSKHRSE